MKISSSKGLLIVFVALIVVLMVANYGFFHVIQTSGTEISNLQREVTSLKTQVEEFSKYSPEDLKALAQSITAKIIPRGDVVDFIEEIESSARSQGIEISVESVDVVPRSEDANDNKQIMNLNLVTKGSWQETMYFINYIEHLPYKIAIKNMNLAKNTADEGAGNGDWRGSFRITALKFK
jgi:Tfp pilus assembly protein PilO